MKKALLLMILTALMFPGLSGCASSVKFNRDYLPDAAPDQPLLRIRFPARKSRMIAQYLRQPRITNFIRLNWRTDDIIYLDLEDSTIFAIDPRTDTIRALDGAQANAAKQNISQKVNVSLNQEGMDVMRRLAASIFSYGGQRLTGSINTSGHTISVDVKTVEQRSDSNPAICASAKLIGRLTNERNRATDIEWDFDCQWMPQAITEKKVPQLLGRLQVSPAGRYYLYGSLLYQADLNQTVGDLFDGYPNIIAVAANPRWTEIAVFRSKGKSYWIEIFPGAFHDHPLPVMDKSD